MQSGTLKIADGEASIRVTFAEPLPEVRVHCVLSPVRGCGAQAAWPSEITPDGFVLNVLGGVTIAHWYAVST